MSPRIAYTSDTEETLVSHQNPASNTDSINNMDSDEEEDEIEVDGEIDVETVDTNEDDDAPTLS